MLPLTVILNLVWLQPRTIPIEAINSRQGRSPNYSVFPIIVVGGHTENARNRLLQIVIRPIDR